MIHFTYGPACQIGACYMSKSYAGWRENISTGHIILEKFSEVTKETMKVFPLSKKVLVMLCSYGTKLSWSLRSRRQQARSRYPEKLFRLI